MLNSPKNFGFKTAIKALMICTTIITNLNSSILFTDYKDMSPEQAVETLQKKQIDNPLNPEINYNLGVAQYKTGNFKEAKINFKRTLEHTTKKLLKKQALFNLGSSCYKKALSHLPDDRKKEETKASQDALEKSISETKESMQFYKKLLKKDPENIKAKNNLKKSEKLFKKLEEKKMWLLKNQQKSERNQKKDDKGKENEKKGETHQKSQKTYAEGNDKKSQHKNGQQKDQAQPNHKQSSPLQDKDRKKLKQSSLSQGTEEKQQRQDQQASTIGKTSEQSSSENREMRSTHAILDNLQSDESKLQKKLFLKKINQSKPSHHSNQKPW